MTGEDEVVDELELAGDGVAVLHRRGEARVLERAHGRLIESVPKSLDHLRARDPALRIKRQEELHRAFKPRGECLGRIDSLWLGQQHRRDDPTGWRRPALTLRRLRVRRRARG